MEGVAFEMWFHGSFCGPLVGFLCPVSLRKCRAIAKMLTERAILKDALPHDRVLSGAKNLLLKYALGSLVKEVIVGGIQKASLRSGAVELQILAQ